MESQVSALFRAREERQILFSLRANQASLLFAASGIKPPKSCYASSTLSPVDSHLYGLPSVNPSCHPAARDCSTGPVKALRFQESYELAASWATSRHRCLRKHCTTREYQSVTS